MVYRRRRRATRKPRRKQYRRIGRRGALYPRITFTETLPVTPILANQGGNWSVTIGELPQFQSYQALYRQYKITKLQVMVFPEQNTGQILDPSGVTPALVYSSLGRFAYAVNNSSLYGSPSSELDVLKDNGCKIRDTSKNFSVSCRPMPKLQETDGNTSALVYTNRRGWIDLDSGSGIVHMGISYWFSAPDPLRAQLYYKVTFALKDPR